MFIVVMTMRPFAEKFYQSIAWKRTRDAYARSKHHLCELCHAPGQIVHHRKHLTPANINNATVTLAWTNLQLLCRKCHAEQHGIDLSLVRERAPTVFDAAGNMVPPIREGYSHLGNTAVEPQISSGA
jgi:hypothetical protein